MKEFFQWVPWFGELAKKVGEVRREGLVERAKKVDWAGGKCAVLAEGEEKADPLTFFYHLASIAGGKAEKRETVYASVAKVFGIESELDHSFGGGFILPTPPGFAVMFKHSRADSHLLWEIFDQACAVEDTSYDPVTADTFAKMLQIKGVGIPKLTQVLFLINPKVFLPFDTAGVLPLGIGKFLKPPATMSWDEYVDEMGRIRAAFPGCECYEINVIGYLWTSGQLPRKGNRWYQISASDDGWPDFVDSNWVYHRGQGDEHPPAGGEVPPGPKQVFRLDEPKPGDVVLVRSGRQGGRGIGIVYLNDYSEQSSRAGRIHVLWVNKEQASLAATMPTVPFSIVGRAAYETFAKSTTYSETLKLLQPPNGPTPVIQLNDLSGRDRSFTSMIQSLKAQGLHFPREAVANYILALQTKRFAILTGISGTGKTRIAKAVAQYFEHSEQRRVAKISEDAVGVEVKPSYIKHSKLVLPVAISAHLSYGAGAGPGSGPNIRVRYQGSRTKLRTYVTRGQHLMLLFKGDFKKWFQSTVEVGDQFWIQVYPSDTDELGELEIGVPETKVVKQRLDNYVVVPVRPDWVDNRGLLGYLNPLTNEYSTTRFLNLLLRAQNEEMRAKDAGEQPHPFFVILDEMNLARVEHYFSDFLSALESGEDIPLHEDEAVESGDSESGPQVPRRLKVPGNVLFTGTVNVDETTYMFSPKVLDRAFTIEFNQVDLEGFTKGKSSEDASELALGGIEDSLDLLRSGASGDDDWKPSRDDWVKFSEETRPLQKALLQLHDILEAEHRHFGYRVANEIARFVNLAREQAMNADADAVADAAFDLALLQKVLPKFHGTQQELESLLERIFHFSVHGGDHRPKQNEKVESDDWMVVAGRLAARSKAKTPAPTGDTGSEAEGQDPDDAKVPVADTQSPLYPRTGAKVLRMLQRLRDRGFTSFIE